MLVRIWISTRFSGCIRFLPIWFTFLLSAAFPCAAATVTSVTFDRGSIVGGSTQQATVTIQIQRGPLDTGDIELNVVTGGQTTGVLINNYEPVVPAGSNSTSTWIQVGTVQSAPVTLTLTASVPGAPGVTSSISVVPFEVSLSLSPSSMVGGSTQSMTATASLNPEPAGGATVRVTSSGSLMYNYAPTIPAGSTSVTFPVSAPNVVPTTQIYTLTATVGVSATQNVTVLPLQLVNINAPSLIYLNSNTTITGTVSLNADVSGYNYQVTSATGDAYPYATGISNSSTGTFTITPERVGSDTLTAKANGSSVSTPIQVIDAGDPKPKCNCGQGGYPINFTTGNVWIEESDYSIPGLGGGLKLTRMFNSLWPTLAPPQTAGMFGHSWTSTFEEHIQSIAGGFFRYWAGDGSTWTFSFDSAHNTYSIVAPQDAYGTMTYDSVSGQTTVGYPTGERHVFDMNKNLIAIIDRNGNQISIAYDQYGRIKQVTDAAGRSLTFTYPNASAKQVSSISDSSGTVASYTYDASLNLTKVLYADGGALNFVYSNGDVTSVTDANSKMLETHTYDASHRGLTSAGAGGVDSITVSYTSTSSTHIVDSANNASDYGFATIGGAGYVNSITGSGCASCGNSQPGASTFDDHGNALSNTDSMGIVTTYTYDAQGNMTSKSRPLDGSHNQAWRYSYNSFNEVLTATDPLGNTTTNTYDAQGNLLSTTTPAPDGNTPASVTSFTYDSKGELLTTTDPLNQATTFTYTPAGLIATVTDAQNNVTTYGYDARGNRTSITDANHNQTTFAYDSRNRLTKITYPDQSTMQYGYDTRGRRISVTDGNSHLTSYAYDDADRLISVTDAQTPTHGVTQYAYDNENNLTSITDALNRQTTFTYDKFRRLTKTTFPSTLSENYTYDANNNLSTKTDRNANTMTYVYDNLNRMTAKQYPNSGGTVNYSYDLADRRTQASDSTGTYGFSYDNMGRLTGTSTQYSFIPGQTFTLSYGYDAASNRTSMTDPQGGITTYTYDSLSRLQNLTDPSSNSFGFAYDALSRRTSTTRPNGVNTTYSYDSLSRLLSVLHQAGGATIDGAVYTYDNAGNRLSKLNELNGVTENYTYDPIYQLTQVQQILNGTPSVSESYSYDLVGNRLSSLDVASYSYNSSKELRSSSDGYSYTYDANGNTLSDASKTYTWDVENRLSSVTLPGNGGTVSFKYDPFGRRIQKSGPLGTTNFLYDGPNLLEEVDNAGNVLARYSGGPWIDETLSQLQAGASSYFEQDGLGSVTSLSNAAGALANTYTYDSFGKPTASTGTLTNPFQFTGREFDAETGLRYYRFRYFDPTIGRFISEDPIGFDGGINFYRYVQNNPLLLTDPFGLSSMTFNRANGSLTLYDKNGNVVAVCTAANNTTRSSNGPWPNGTYPFSSHNNHPPDPNGPYGSYGIDVFDVPGRTGMGVHSGRANKGGPNHPTLGCVRTDDNCMKQITDWQAHDPMTDITIQ